MSTVVSIRQSPRGFKKVDGVQFGQYVYIGRPGQFGNPVAKGKPCPVCRAVHVDNGSTLPCYEIWLIGKLRTDPNFRRLVAELHDKTLVCFCAKGQPCHGHVLARFAEKCAHPTPRP